MTNIKLADSPLFAGKDSYSKKEFWHHVALYRQACASLVKDNSQANVLLFDNNIFRFLVRLIALGLEGCTVVLPPNDQQGTIEDILPDIDYIAGDILIDHQTSLEKQTDKVNARVDAIKGSMWPTTGELIFFTSGSSGKAKAITKSWTQINNELSVLQTQFRFATNSVFISTVSHQHIYGLLFRALLPLKLGNTLYESFEYPEHIAAVISDKKHCVLVSSPAFLSRLVKDNVLEKHNSCFDYIFSSGGKLIDSDAFLLFKQMKQGVVQVYGSTETGGIAHRQVETSADELWQFFPNVSCQVDSETKQLILTSPFIQENQLLLEDLGEIHSGKLRLLGRIDRTIKLEEKRINLTLMESLCEQHVWISQARFLLLEQRRTILVAVIKLNELGNKQLEENGTRFINNQLKAHLLTHFELVTLPRKWRYVEEFPYNAQGKLPVAELEKLFV
ncbi:AMP-binding protein [Thalassotalea sp. PLHSN55]|uniref:AMP-binding protein n=1 Tax=Thalassotalea sp. PLHSN55 TaxID=3435888 RepID=UPI003F86FE43